MVTELERLRVGVTERYRVERELARGGMATVYLAEDVKHHRHVAIKVLKPELAGAIAPDRFHRQTEIAARPPHPPTLPLYAPAEPAGPLNHARPFAAGKPHRAAPPA